jgi:hypothetical protein
MRLLTIVMALSLSCCGSLVVAPEPDLTLAETMDELERVYPVVDEYLESFGPKDLDLYGLLGDAEGIRRACIGELRPGELTTHLSCYDADESTGPADSQWDETLFESLVALDELWSGDHAEPESSGWFVMFESESQDGMMKFNASSNISRRSGSENLHVRLSSKNSSFGFGYFSTSHFMYGHIH